MRVKRARRLSYLQRKKDAAKAGKGKAGAKKRA
jgi:hypothetical protein